MDPELKKWVLTGVTFMIVLLVGYLLQELADRPGDGKRWLKLILAGMLLLALAASLAPAFARDDGRYANSPLKQWFDGLKSGRGPCCSDADGFAVADPDWRSSRGHYQVRLEDQWHDVPDDAVITEPNRVGRTMVWPIKGWGGITIRCFMPGSMT